MDHVIADLRLLTANSDRRLSLRCDRESSLAFSGWTFVSKLTLPLTGHLNVHLSSIHSGSAGRREGHGVVHGSHWSHLSHVKVQRHGAHVDRFTGRICEREHDFLIAVFELTCAVGKRAGQITERHCLDRLSGWYAVAGAIFWATVCEYENTDEQDRGGCDDSLHFSSLHNPM
jgi:hypothetical protein